MYRSFRGLAAVGAALVCAGLAQMPAQAQLLTLIPPSPTEFGGTPAADGGVGDERGLFINALSTFSITSLGIEADPTVASLGFTANIYAATGLTRGSLLATNTVTLPDAGQGFYTVPIAFTFTAGQTYDIAVDFSNASTVLVRFVQDNYPTYNVGGVINVPANAGELSGNAGNGVSPVLQVNLAGASGAAPEPGTLALMAGAFLIPAAALRRRQSRNAAR
jgi:hypothetical protein